MANLPCAAGCCPHALLATWSLSGGVLARRMQRCEREGCIEAALAGLPWPPAQGSYTAPTEPAGGPPPGRVRSHLPTHMQPASKVA